MNKISLRKNSVMDYDAYIFDLDGTLYYQKPFRVKMLLTLTAHVIRHPASLRDLLIIKKYREVREHWETCEPELSFAKELNLDERQYAYVAAKKGVSPSRVQSAVEFFMLGLPLSVLPPYRDELLSGFIKRLREKQKKIVVYSDYPAEEKLKALGIEADFCYTAGDARIACMKPDPKGLAVILRELHCGGADALMIGDRYEKDGLAAERNGVDYIIVSGVKRERAALKDMWA